MKNMGEKNLKKQKLVMEMKRDLKMFYIQKKKGEK